VEGLQKGGKANVKLADERLVDSVILAGAAETEHHEIAVYENLITQAEALDEQDVVALLQGNLEQEQHTLQKVTQEACKIARQLVGRRPDRESRRRAGRPDPPSRGAST
jgi:ferritin-like metal-binding protein YciE